MKKIIIMILLFTLFSCSWGVKNNTQKQETINNNTESIKDATSQTATGIEVWMGIIQQPISHISNISHTEVWFDGFSLAGNVTPDIEKMEIVWKNNAKTNTYTLQKYQKWSGEFKSNLKQSFWNLEYWENVYQIKAYVWEKVVDEKEYKINYEKKGCEIILKSYYHNIIWDVNDGRKYEDNFLKYEWKIRKFKFNTLWNCKNQTIKLPYRYIFDNWQEIYIQDIWSIVWVSWWVGSWAEDKKEEKLSNKSLIYIWKSCEYDINDFNNIICKWSEIWWEFSSIRFSYTNKNASNNHKDVVDTYNKIKNILLSMEELSLDEIKIDEKSVDLSKIQIYGDTITFSDKNDVYKSFKIVDYKYFQDWGTFEDIKNNPNTDLTFTKLENWKLYVEIYQWSPISWGFETKLVFDINTGKVLSKK